MAKAAKIFTSGDSSGNTPLYTVPNGKFAIVNAHVSASTSCSMVVNGVTVANGNGFDVQGMVIPGGSSFRLQLNTGCAGICSGFEYDA